MSEKAEILNEIIEEKIEENPEKPIEFFTLAIRFALDTICGIFKSICITRTFEYLFITILYFRNVNGCKHECSKES